MIYDSGVGFLDFKALSLKDELDREDKNKFIVYMKPLMVNAAERNVINRDNYHFYLINFLHQKVSKYRMMFNKKKLKQMLLG